MSSPSLSLWDTTTTLSSTQGGIIDTDLIGLPNGMGVQLAVQNETHALYVHLEPLEAVELATNLLLYARAAAWDGEVL